MLAARNHRFRLAALCGAAAYLLLTVGELVDANRLSGYSSLPGGYLIGVVVMAAAHLVGICGWLALAVAFGKEIAGRRLRLGATILASTEIASAAGFVLRTLALLPYLQDGGYETSYIVAAVGGVLTAVAACVVAFGLAEARRGPTRSVWLRWGAIVAAAAFLATTISQLFLQSFYSRFGAPDQATIGFLAIAVGGFGLATGALFFARSASRPLGRREAGLAGAAALGGVGTLCIAGGEALIASLYDHGVDTAVPVSLWLGVANRVVFAGVFFCVALGARTAAEPAPVPA